MPLHEPDRYRILIADDEAPILEEYNAVLSEEPATVGNGGSLASLDADLFGDAQHTVAQPTFDLCLCRQAEAAIAAVRQSIDEDDPFAVAFLDVRMPPGANGIDAAESIRMIDPDINIVIVTGYSDVPLLDIVARVPPMDRLLYCKKPLQANELRQFAFALTRKWYAERELQRKILSQTEQLEGANQQLLRSNEELQAATEAAKAAERAKSHFLTNMSHELRTPLNAIIGYAELLQEEAQSRKDDMLLGDLGKVQKAGRHLLGLINNILDLSKVEAGKMDVDIQDATLDGMLVDIEDIVRPLVVENGNVFEISNDATVTEFATDTQMLCQALLNLLGNAAKFTKNGEVRLEVTQEGAEWLNFIVSDTGVGISDDRLNEILEPFTQGDVSISNEYGGTGLGLTITKSLTELLCGRLSVESEAGQGSRFTISLPIRRAEDDTSDSHAA
ncbi:MAG: ATP-binding protein [Alphaproteobacteria bacterium]|nr:ATP-binding protein [Alphaproteobacteria bacterium]